MYLRLPKRLSQKQAQRIVRNCYGQQRTIFARNPQNPKLWRCVINGRPFEGSSILALLMQDEMTSREIREKAHKLEQGRSKHRHMHEAA